MLLFKLFLDSNNSGNNNTALGTYAGMSSEGSGNVFIGYSAGSRGQALINFTLATT